MTNRGDFHGIGFRGFDPATGGHIRSAGVPFVQIVPGLQSADYRGPGPASVVPERTCSVASTLGTYIWVSTERVGAISAKVFARCFSSARLTRPPPAL